MDKKATNFVNKSSFLVEPLIKGDDQFLVMFGSNCQSNGYYDNNGVKYTDFAMSLVPAGHAYEPILNAVRKELVKGSNFVGHLLLRVN